MSGKSATCALLDMYRLAMPLSLQLGDSVSFPHGGDGDGGLVPTGHTPVVLWAEPLY